MTFQIGEKIVYPNHGVGTIENISTRSFGAHCEHFYLLRLYTNSLTVMVPFSHAEDVGLRRVTRNGEVAKVLMYLSNRPMKKTQDWKNRFRENSEKMRVGGLLEIAEVLKALLILQGDKPLSFREKRMLEIARRMLISEVATSRGLLERDTIDLLQKALGKAALAMPQPL